METEPRRNFNEKIDDHTTRVLLVIPRMSGQQGLAYQSTGMRLVNGLCKTCREYFHVEVLHAPTYARLTERLVKANSGGKPFHILHYDGHGAFLKPAELGDRGQFVSTPENDQKETGYLLLESAEKPDYLDGSTLGRLLVDNGVKILSLNTAQEPADSVGENQVKNAFMDVIDDCQAAGLPGALAIADFYLSDAPAIFLGNVYAAFAQGKTLEEAVDSEQQYFTGLSAQGKKAGDFVPDNWRMPICKQFQPVQIPQDINFPSSFIFRISFQGRGREMDSQRMDARLLKLMPEGGVYGRDDLALRLEGAFDFQNRLLLHGEEGSGKTCAALEFARWQANSGAIGNAPILYTNLKGCASLTDVLDEFGVVYEKQLLDLGMVWNELDDDRRQKLIKDVLKFVRLLWIWDNFERVYQDGFTSWDQTEIDRLLEFLKSMADTVGHFLLISSNSEKKLDTDIARIKLTPMAHSSLASLVCTRLKDHPLPGVDENSIFEKIGERAVNFKVLDIFFKHPEMFTAPLCTARLEDAVVAMLNELSPADQSIAVMFPMFNNVLNPAVLAEMGNPQRPWCLPELKGLSQDEIQAVMDRAKAVGLITDISGQQYLVDAGLSFALMPELQRRYSFDKISTAFIQSMAVLSRDLSQRWENGDKEQIDLLKAEAGNLKQALILAHQHGLRDAMIDLLTGLRLVHRQDRRDAPWASLLDLVAPDILTTTGKVGKEMDQEALFWVDSGIELCELRRMYNQAAQWLQYRVDWERRLAANALGRNAKSLDQKAEKEIRDLAGVLARQGEFYRQAESPKTIDTYKAAFRAVKSLPTTELAGVFAFKIAEGYITIPDGQNLDLARYWIKKSLDLRPEVDRLGRALTTALFARVETEKFAKAQKEKLPVAKQIGYINEALGYFFDALDLFPEDASREAGTIHENIGYLYLQIENGLDEALVHYNEAISLKEKVQDIYGPAKVRYNLALALFTMSRFDIGQPYAHEALRGFESMGAAYAVDIQKAKGLVAKFTNTENSK